MNRRLAILVGILLLLGATIVLFTGCALKKKESVNNPSVPRVSAQDENTPSNPDTSKKNALVNVPKKPKNESTEESMIGKTVTCPVTGERFTITKDTPTYTYKGESYYFCCEACVPKFKAAPEKYIQGMSDEPAH